jgi:BirA family biotin operon repressor/biotin-[acetyl-CoA-carboxylase] ligase
MTDTLAADAVVPLIRGRFGIPFLYRSSCESTQRLLEPELPEGATAVCEHQTTGRGRLGRRWEAPPGTAILCSVLLRPAVTTGAAGLSLVAGLAVARVVERALGHSCALKWPNDVLVEGRKVAGALGEIRAGAVVLGIGLNVNQDESELPKRVVLPATSLRLVDGVERARAPLLAELLLELEGLYERWRGAGLSALAGEIDVRDYLRGRRVAAGELTGVAVGIAPDGQLELETAAGRRLVASGDVTVVAPA